MKKRTRNARRHRRPRHVVLTSFCVALVLIIVGLGVYTAVWYLNLDRIRRNSERYAQLYEGRNTPAPTLETAATAEAVIPNAPEPVATSAPEPIIEKTPEPVDTSTPEPMVTNTPEPVVTSTPEPMVTNTPEPVVTSAPEPTVTKPPESVVTSAPEPTVTEPPEPVVTSTPEPTVTKPQEPVVTSAPEPVVTNTPESVATGTPEPTVTNTPEPVVTSDPSPTPTAPPFGSDMPIAEDVLIPTPGADTLVYALPTAPPVQASFDALLALNAETVGFLEIEDMLSLPVVQRENDNDYYLSHTFEDEEATEGCLFLDGLNRLVPEDDCLIVYGHNMKNKTMFGRLNSFGDLNYLKGHSVIRFDTLYENRNYVAFAAFTASMEPGNSRYFDVRNFVFDEAEFDKFVLKLQSRSIYKSPVEATYGDRLLLLVTCDYTSREGRFILALRQLRPGETEADALAQVAQTAVK